MRMFFPAGLALSCIGLVSCGFALQSNSGSEVKDTPASDAVTQVNPKAFNAFLLWRDGKGDPILDYPAGYDVRQARNAPDGVFYVDWNTYWEQNHPVRFSGSVTEGAKVEGDLLTYPAKEGRTLALKFSAPSEKQLTHADAVQHCKAAGLRLPHVQEILDFCAAGTKKTEVDWHSNWYYGNNRCKKDYWSASVYSYWLYDQRYAWYFSNVGIVLFDGWRDGVTNVRCVGGE